MGASRVADVNVPTHGGEAGVGVEESEEVGGSREPGLAGLFGVGEDVRERSVDVAWVDCMCFVGIYAVCEGKGYMQTVMSSSGCSSP